jgi:RNA polymerase sigma factor (sigma-70 family)
MIAFENKRETDKPDAELVSESLAGDRSAFSQIVVRYQTLISGLAYSATGSLSRSEDLAQDVFVRAWKELPQLREPAKLRPWLCSIARFMISKARRRDQHEPIHSAEPLDQAPELPTIEPWPSEGAINREEEMILWRSLKRIPEPYREPLVLFYREHQSIQRVAAALDLTEDAVKQRLSRGRKLLHQEVLLFVEGALERTNPGPALGLAVMAAIGVGTISAKAATVGTVAMSGKSAATAKGMSLFGGVGVAAMFLAAVGGQFAVLWGRIRSGRSPRERRFLAQSTLGFFGWKLLLLIGVFIMMSLDGGALVINSLSDAVPWIGLWIGLLGLWVAYSTWMARRQKAIRLVEETSVVADTGEPHDGSNVDHSALTAGVYGVWPPGYSAPVVC